MNARAYLNQAYRLEHRVILIQNEITNLRSLATSIRSPSFEEHLYTGQSNDASHVRIINKIIVMEKECLEELQMLLELKEQMLVAISQLSAQDESLTLRYRYLCNWTWTRIAEELNVEERTVRRWHDRAINHFKVPDNPIIIEKSKSCPEMS